MTDVLALENLYTVVVARFAAESTTCTSAFGWREAAQQVIGPRIVWIPGDPSGNAGKDYPPRNPGGNPRSIGTLRELFHVIISSSDDSAPQNELLQYKATRLLRDAWHRAVYLAAYGAFAIQSETWIIDKKEARYGTALLIVCEIQSMIPDEVQSGAPVDTDAVVPVSVLNVTDTLTVSPADVP